MSRASLKSAFSKLPTPSSHVSDGKAKGKGAEIPPFRIAADGRWFYRGSPIERPAMVRLFATVLRREGDGYALVTPYERHAVAVEDAPFLAVAVKSEGEGRERRLVFTTNVDGEVAAGSDHPVVMRGTTDEPRPYVALGGGLEARISRSVYYELAALAEPGTD